MDYMERFGMPDRDSPEFQDWFDANATRVYGLFLLTHPRFVVTTLWGGLFYSSSDSVQPYFKADDVTWRDTLVKMGEFLHPKSLLVYLIDVLLLRGFYVHAVQQRRSGLVARARLGTWFPLCAAVTLFPPSSAIPSALAGTYFLRSRCSGCLSGSLSSPTWIGTGGPMRRPRPWNLAALPDLLPHSCPKIEYGTLVL